MIETIIAFAILLSVLVFIHEAGHYFTAKFFGIKVEEFGFGFPPRVWGKKIGETIYSLNLLPIGGFVKLFGEDEAGGGSIKASQKSKVKSKKSDLDRAFFAKPAWQRAFVVFAGVVMNFLLAVIIFYAFLILSSFKTEIPKLANQTFYFSDTNVVSDVVLSDIAKDSPAASAGIQIPSAVVAVNSEKINSVEEFVKKVDGVRGEKIKIELKDLTTQEVYTVSLTPRENPPKGQGAIGVGLFAYETYVISYSSPFQKLISGVIHPINLMSYNLNVIGVLIGQSFARHSFEPVGQGVSGPVGIFSIVGQVISIPDFKEKVLQILNLAGILSISLAFFNVLPIPALDGGRLFFILAEIVTKKKVNPKYEAAIHAVGLFVLMGLIIFVSLFDILKLFSK